MPVIVASPAYPRPPLDGDKLRWSALLPELARLDQVHGLFGLMPSLGEKRDAEFEQDFASIDVVPTPRLEVTARAVLLEIRRRPSAFGRRATPAWRGRLAAVASRHRNAPVLLLGTSAGFVTGLSSNTFLDLIDVRSRLRTLSGDRTVSRDVLEAELGLARRHRVILASESDRRYLLSFGVPEARVGIVPNGVDTRLLELTPQLDSATLLFVGSLRYRPNLQGIRWFISACWPALLERQPAARLRIVGYGADQIQAGPGIEVYSDVPDVRPHYQAGALCIAPLLEARGVQNKVLEAMAAGLPVVSTAPVAAGLFPDHPIVVADEAAGLIDACLRLLNDGGERQRLKVEGRTYIRRHHDWARSGAQLRELLLA